MKRLLATTSFLVGCQSAYKENLKSEAYPVSSKVLQMEFLAEQSLGGKFSGSEVELGGLSGLEWNEKTQVMYAVSDDRGWKGSSRYYELKFKGNSYESLQLEVNKEITLKTRKGEAFKKRSVDPEAIALIDESSVLIASEGDFEKTKDAVPGIFRLDQQGRKKSFFAVGPPVFPKDGNWKTETYGVRFNKSLESLSYHKRLKRLITATENTLVQDGEMADRDKTGLVRIFQYGVKPGFSLQLIDQKVYPLSKIPAKNVGEDSDIGVSDMITLDVDRYLVLERSYLGGRSKNRVQLFLADCRSATDVKKEESLLSAKFERCKKDLVYDFDVLIGKLKGPLKTADNLEGMSFGPKLSDGSQLLIFVSDNNFMDKPTQVLYFKTRLNL